ncbi:MAG: hypothetical protein ACRDQB_06240 [Thermocrispum sp.]
MNTIAGSAVLVMALAGCNDEDTGAPASDPDGSGGTSSSAPAGPDQGDKPADSPGERPDAGIPETDEPNVGKPPAGAKPLPSKQIDADALPQGHPKKVQVKGSTLAITAQESGCEKATAELGKQGDSQVVVTLLVTQPKEAEMCTMDIRFPSLSVQLDEPIGERTVVLKHDKRKE